MELYHMWISLRQGVKDTQYYTSAKDYFEYLKGKGLLEHYRITRRKLGLSPECLRPWHVTLEFKTMAQLDEAFQHVSTRADPVETFHHAVNSKVENIFFALYRDFPDENRVHGQEKF